MFQPHSYGLSPIHVHSTFVIIVCRHYSDRRARSGSHQDTCTSRNEPDPPSVSSQSDPLPRHITFFEPCPIYVDIFCHVLISIISFYSSRIQKLQMKTCSRVSNAGPPPTGHTLSTVSPWTYISKSHLGSPSPSIATCATKSCSCQQAAIALP